MSNTRKPVPASGEKAPAAVEATKAEVEKAKDEDASTDAEQSKSDDGDDAGADQAELVEARVLVDFEGRVVNDIVAMPSDDIDTLVLAGRVDPHPAAVAYAKSLKAGS